MSSTGPSAGERALVMAIWAGAVLLGCTAENNTPCTQRHLDDSDVHRIVLIPDTQYYTYGELIPLFAQQTQWIAEHARALDIVFAIHLGDITEHNTPVQWQVASDAMGLLDGVVPYSVLPGNHDGIHVRAGEIDTPITQYFPPERFADQEGGYMDGRPENSYWLISAGSQEYLVLSLGYGVPDEVIAWADEVIRSHSQHRVIVATHAYLKADGTRLLSTDLYGPVHPRWNDGQELWDKLIRWHPTIFLVVSGHITGDAVRVSYGNAGNPVYEILADYQWLEQGGSGWLRMLSFYPAQQAIQVQAYSPYLDQFDEPCTLDYLFEPLP